MAGKTKAVVLDRDGTIIEEKNYLSRVSDARLIPGAAKALASLSRAGYILIVATNQSGVARGYLTERKLAAINRKIVAEFARRGARISAVYYCPHPVDGKCSCRKPAVGMLDAARRKFRFDPSKSFCVGDKITDVEFGHNGGLKSVMVLTGHGAEEVRAAMKRPARRGRPDYVADDVADAARWILSRGNARSGARRP